MDAQPSNLFTPSSTAVASSTTAAAENDNDDMNESLSERFRRAITSPSDMAHLEDLLSIQEQVAHLNLFSRNETLEDVSTASIPLLALEHYIAVAYTNLPTVTLCRPDTTSRWRNVCRASDLWQAFLQRLEHYECLDATEREQFHDLVETTSNLITSLIDSTRVDSDNNSRPPTLFSVSRDVKIARFRAKQTLEQQQQQLRALQQRRQRLSNNSTDVLDGHDDESLEREMAISQLQLCKLEALEEWSSTVRELPMIQQMIRQQANEPTFSSRTAQSAPSTTLSSATATATAASPPFQLTQIQRGANGQLMQVHTNSKEVLQQQVFRPGWNQPTLRLEDYAYRQVQDALARQERDQQTAADAESAPRRMEYLLRDGLEDHADLVDASAALDRSWDDFRDQNPRGSGNKRANVGDRNF